MFSTLSIRRGRPWDWRRDPDVHVLREVHVVPAESRFEDLLVAHVIHALFDGPVDRVVAASLGADLEHVM